MSSEMTNTNLDNVDAKPSSQVSDQQIKCISPMTFSQKLYQSHAIEIAEEFEQAIEANSLEKIKNLLDKILDKRPRAYKVRGCVAKIGRW